jgi:tRNA A-37 threonylcarbamoyl transferase component Bud32
VDRTRRNQREILIRYGRLAPHAQDRILDQFYLILPGSMSLQGFLITQTFALIAGSVGIALFASAILLAIGEAHSLGRSLYFCFVIEVIWVFVVMHLNYARRYREKPFDLTEIGLTNDELRLHSRNIHGGMILDSFAWDEISSIEFVEGLAGENKELTRDHIILSDTRKHQARLFLDSLQTIEERNILRAFIASNIKQIDTQKAMAGLTRTGKLADIPFTKLWSQALRDSRPRLHTNALSTDIRLQNGRFTIKNLIGGGGQGAVYMAEANDLSEHSIVVLKEYILPDLVHEVEHKDACEQFEKEVHLLSKLNHPGIVKMFDAFVEDHRAYLVLEMIAGHSLKEEVQNRGTIPYREVLKLCKQMTAILEHLHGATPIIIHLDFSPENLMLSPEGKITVIDFNISSEENSMRTRTIMGKQRYMAPEQYRGKPSIRSDIYALGATLYFLLTGLEPEPITTARCRKNSKNAEDIPESIDTFVSQATALDEKQRFQSIAEVQAELTKLIENTGS